ncbi:MAG TPA: hypothetical protein VMW83_15950, partial [Spirochaetia bacterium]|nr:hypothetical protein [Spirochaetia bacterium]
RQRRHQHRRLVVHPGKQTPAIAGRLILQLRKPATPEREGSPPGRPVGIRESRNPSSLLGQASLGGSPAAEYRDFALANGWMPSTSVEGGFTHDILPWNTSDITGWHRRGKGETQPCHLLNLIFFSKKAIGSIVPCSTIAQ